MRSTQPEIEYLFFKTLKEQLGNRAAGVKITAAYSGGPDSTVLLYLLKKFQNDLGYSLDAAYVNHGIRSSEEMLEEEQCVRQLALDCNIPLHLRRIAPGFLDFFSKRTSCGMESAARTYRYRFFYKILHASEFKGMLALGHNRNDQEETILMRLFSGSGIEGLKGIPETSETLIRPLIAIDRNMILSYLDEKDLPHVHDSSNFESCYLRNRIRNVLFKQIVDIFPDAGNSIIRLGAELSSVLVHYNNLLDKECSWQREGECYSCEVRDFLSIPYVSRRGLLLKKINSLLRGDALETRIPRNFFLPLDRPDYSEGVVLKGHNIVLLKKKNRLILKKDLLSPLYENIFFHLSISHPFHSEFFSLEIQPVCPSGTQNNSALFLLDNPHPVIVRSPFSITEKRKYSVVQNESIYIIHRGDKSFFVLNSKGKCLNSRRTVQKRSEIDPASMYQCVIITGRGDYAPG